MDNLSDTIIAVENTAAPTVTIVLVPRERFSRTPAVLNTLYANTDYPFELVCIDGNSPPVLRDYLVRQANQQDFRLVRTEHFLSPNQARNLGLQYVGTDYVVFIDNDCEVAPGWLSALIRCAMETGAAAVAPLYFEGSPENQQIHMAGGTAGITMVNGNRIYKANYFHEHSDYDTVRDEIFRTEIEIFEFHCVLLSTTMLNRVGPPDEGLLSAFEHDDLSLRLREAEGSIFLEPDAKVTYTFGSLNSSDAAFAKVRWSHDWNCRTISHFRDKWGLDESWGRPSIDWCNNHRRRILRETRTLPYMTRKALKNAMLIILGRQRFDAVRALRG